MSNCEPLVKQIYEVSKHYEEIARLSGENFNIFEILDLSSNELRHSKFIATLLDPNGAHGQGEIFLKYFIGLIGIDISSDDDLKKIEVDKEFSIEEGRIDILLHSDKFEIIIENKIYANDQPKQLVRYNDYLSKYKATKKTKLIYLTLYGDKASEESAVDLKEEKDYQCIAYKDTIITWLNMCNQEVADLPFLRGNIKQYILLINKLTGQSRSEKMSDEIVDILMKDEENIKAAFDIHNNIYNLQIRIIDKHLIPALQNIASKYGLELESIDSDYFGAEWGFQFVNPNWNYTKIYFHFASKMFRYLYYGFYNSPDKQVSNEIKTKFKDYKNYVCEENFPLWKYMDTYQDWGNNEFLELAKGQKNKIADEIDLKIKELLKIAKEVGEGL